MDHKIHLLNENGRLACEKNINRGPDVACYMVERWVIVPTSQRCKICERIFQKGAVSAGTDNGS